MQEQAPSAGARQGTDGPGLDPGQFARIASLARRRFGLDLPERKRLMVSSRLTLLQRSLLERGRTDITSLGELVDHLERSEEPGELLGLFDALSTNLTHFFREREHLDLLVESLRAEEPWSKLRIWSAGCSKGCEPYSIVMALREAFPDLDQRDFKLLATDFAVSVLAEADRGVYPQQAMKGLGADDIAQHFEEVPGGYSPRPEVRSPITFALLNLIEPWKMRGPFDAIFCRNVMIYFDNPTREALIRRFTGLLRPGGLLFLGTSEGLTGNQPELLRVAPSSFRKK